MKKLFIILALTITSVSNIYSDEYFLDRKIQESKDKGSTYAGVITRFGYGFNYDAFTYGASLLYHFDGIFGVTAGFDGYLIPKKFVETSSGTNVAISNYSLPLWDVRAGLLIGRYLGAGVLCGKWMIDNPNVINMRENAWFTSNKDSKVMYGGWVTFILPISKHIGFNIDFALTNKTGFNIGGGVNIIIPVK